MLFQRGKGFAVLAESNKDIGFEGVVGSVVGGGAYGIVGVGEGCVVLSEGIEAFAREEFSPAYE